MPDDLITALESDRDAGVDLALDMVAKIRDSGAFDGVHLVPVGRYTADRRKASRRPGPSRDQLAPHSRADQLALRGRTPPNVD